MKFTVREGFVVKTITEIELGDGRIDRQENFYHGGQKCDLTNLQAREHAHKLEPDPKDKAAVDFLASLVVDSPAPPTNADIEQLVATKVAAALAAILGPQALAAAASMTPAPGTSSTAGA